ncbi:MAG TPA: DNA-formamidopyrimidine glycosylase family protein [Vicinamibacterales bacterium]|nr:DNA-formamidopyrimidine glycosylase family protein [Vicinamibacterales bacterium]
MPELPDIVVYAEAIDKYVVGKRLNQLRLVSPFVLRSVDPPLASITGRVVRGVHRIGKRIVLEFDGDAPGEGHDLFLVIHLMIAGRLRWREKTPEGKRSGTRGEPKKPPAISPRLILATFEFDTGTLFLTEASSKKRASIRLVRGRSALGEVDPGGIEPLQATREEFREALVRENHTLKRGLTSPRLVSGIGNAYSDEILHAARLSPLKLTRSLSDEEWARLYDATHDTLNRWVQRLRDETGEGFPEKVTAFHDEMAVHGRFKHPCPVCGTPVQRIVYADNECNYCARCQTGGRLLADRSLSRLLKDDWPRSIDEVDQ